MTAVAPPPNRRGARSVDTMLGERYSLTRRLAVGGMGEVWEAIDTVLGRQVAVKVLRDDLVESPVFLERFRAEARHTAALAHNGIASVFDYGEHGAGDRHVAYLVMELVHGEPLSKVMADRGVLPVGMALSLLAQAAEALHAAHVMGVVHRDVKPGNLLLLDDGTIKVTDFGIARAASSVALTEIGQVIGTARYISPEQAVGADATPSSDVYSLGVIGYEMLAGHPPFTAENSGALAMAHVHQPPPPLPESIPAEVRAAIDDALAKDPADRPADAHTFATNLRRLQLATMPPPGAPDPIDADRTMLMAAEEGDGDPVPATEVIGDDTRSRTAIMPSAAVVGNRELGLSEEPFESRRKRRLIGVAVLVLALIVIVATQISGAGVDAPAIDTTTTTTFTGIAVDPNTLVGLPAATASEQLKAAGLVVSINPVDAPGVGPGLVTGVAPSGQVPAGSTVTLDVSNVPPAVPETTAAKPDKKGHNGKNDD